MVTFAVSNMGCGSCVAKITRGLAALDPAARVHVDRAAGRVQVESAADPDALCAHINQLGYPAERVD